MAKKPAEQPAPQSEDVEGHGYMLDPIMARQMSRDRSAEVERRRVSEPARRKPARTSSTRTDRASPGETRTGPKGSVLSL
jgi:hypothetical protein